MAKVSPRLPPMDLELCFLGDELGGILTPPAGTDWTSWDLDLGTLALFLALVPKNPFSDLLTFLGVPSSHL